VYSESGGSNAVYVGLAAAGPPTAIAHSAAQGTIFNRRETRLDVHQRLF
jgi:hypothetical protein